jgi:hypothetical protein
MQVKWKDDDSVPHTVWEYNSKCVIHSVSDNLFLCVWLGDETHPKGLFEKETSSLSDALSWLQE